MTTTALRSTTASITKSPRRPWRERGGLLLAVLLIGGCTSGPLPGPSSESPTSSVPTSNPPSLSPDATPASLEPLPPLPSEGRPVQPIPDVRLPGFADPPPGTGLQRYRGQALDWAGCGRLECADLLVPRDYAAPDDLAITLRVVRQPATRDKGRTLLVNFGGPGAPSQSALAGFRLPGLDGATVVSWDVRGSGNSTPVRCWDDEAMDVFQLLDFSPDSPGEHALLVDRTRRFGLSCLERSGALLEHLSTAESARDLDLVRSALGVDVIDYVGYSNGTLLGAAYAQQFSDHVGRMVLDGATDFGGREVSQVEGFERALTRMDAWCRRTRCLPAGDHAVLDVAADLLSGLDTAPLRVEDRTLTQSLALTGIAAALYAGEAGWPALARAFDAAVRGQAGPLLQLSDLLTTRDSDGDYEQFAYAFPASSCADEEVESLAEAHARSQRENARAPVLGSAWGPGVLCALWPVNSPPALPRLTAPAAPPLVVIGTTGDPATPYEWSEAAANQLESAVLVSNEGDGHTAGHDQRCLTEVVVPFLERGLVPKKGQRC